MNEKQILEEVRENKYCDFYRKLYKGVDLNDWNNLPCISKEDIMNYQNKDKKFLFVDEKNVAGITTTSGTSDISLTIYLSKKDLEMRDEKMKIHVGENYPDDARIISIFTSNFAGKHPKAYEKYVNVEGDIYDLGYSVDLIQKMKINVLRTSPTIAIRVGDVLKLIGYDEIKFFVSSGEPISELTKIEIEKRFPGASISKLCGMSEFSNTGWQCKEFYGSQFYHTLPDYIKYEILTENGKIEEYGKGELILTTLWGDSAFPLIRYKTGDFATLSENTEISCKSEISVPETLNKLQRVSGKCKCGAKGKILSLLGRINAEGIRIAGITLHKKNIDKAISSLGFKEYQIHIYEEEKDGRIYPKIIFNIKGKDKSEKEIQEIEDKLMENLQLTPSYNWKNAVEKKVLIPLEIRFVNELEKNNWKNIGVIDYRIKGGLL